MRERGCFAVRVEEVELEPDPLDGDSILKGTPEAFNRVVWDSDDGRMVRGVWEMTPGTVTDTEANEMFVVISGRATITPEGGEPFDVGPGDMGVLEEGARTTWVVHETLRKAYQILLP
jgi:uncharacterized cupin superfamily protein